ncbi:MAG: ATP-binding cassette domain-containing protein [Bacteroides sp.]|nr:ATP-binding cassette domain-containing protein [Bacteroides sp.]MCM1389974.1 ATP-binding cassette domain-containing protein [Bacteroides sp.]
MSLQVQALSYCHPDKDILFQNINFSISRGEKCAIIGDNGIGKSTLLKIIAGAIPPSSGKVLFDEPPYVVPQHFGQFNEMTVAEAIGVSHKLNALASILDGKGTEEDFTTLNDQWDILDRFAESFAHWHIPHITPHMKMGALSGGEKTKVFLAGIALLHPLIILLDEPTNHLDITGRRLLYEFIRDTNITTVIVSHDRVLLDMLSSIYEMSSQGITFYPMCYSDYKECVDNEMAAKAAQIQNRQKELAKAEKMAQKTMERQQKHASRGEKKSSQKCLARISKGNLHNRSENSTSRLKKALQEKLQGMDQPLSEIRTSISRTPSIKIKIDDATLSHSRRLVEATGVTYAFHDRNTLWQNEPLTFSIFSGERIRIQGDNGSGKSTLLKLITGELQPATGTLFRTTPLNILYLDQEYSCLDEELSVYGIMENSGSLKPEHELKMLLNRFSFPAATWDKKCAGLSGGERMKLALCRLLAFDNAPDIIIADEPTNNLDISSIEILTDTLARYNGTLLIVSHDTRFIDEISIHRTITI